MVINICWQYPVWFCFYDLSIIYWYCSDSVEFVVFHLIPISIDCINPGLNVTDISIHNKQRNIIYLAVTFSIIIMTTTLTEV
jgi:hypothetical protein